MSESKREVCGNDLNGRYVIGVGYCGFSAGHIGPCGELRPASSTPEPAAADRAALVREGDTVQDLVSHEEAREIAFRYINASFRNEGKPRPRHSIPANPREDSDLRLLAYIKQQERAEALVAASPDRYPAQQDSRQPTPKASVTTLAHDTNDDVAPSRGGSGRLSNPAEVAVPPGEQWIPVTERLPSTVQSQVLVVRQENGASPWVGSAWYRGPKRPGERRRGDWECNPWGIVNDVTHWRPLPAPPKGTP